jgi:SPP1 family predicted phage head-tail adaptor
MTSIIGTLRNIGELFVHQYEQNNLGEPIPHSTEPELSLGPIYFGFVGLQGRELFEAQVINEDAEYRVTIRYRDDMVPDMFIRWNGMDLEFLEGPRDKDSRKKFLTMLARNRVTNA